MPRARRASCLTSPWATPRVLRWSSVAFTRAAKPTPWRSLRRCRPRFKSIQPSFRPAFGLTFLSAANPDGLANQTRMLANGVDPNRNWPTADWSVDTYVSGPTLVPGGGGPFPLSEPETQALAALVTQLRPALIVSYHSAAGLVSGGPSARAMGLEALYASAAGYAIGDWTAYPVTGDFAQWAEQRQGIPTIEVELPGHDHTDLEANLAAVRALLWQL